MRIKDHNVPGTCYKNPLTKDYYIKNLAQIQISLSPK